MDPTPNAIIIQNETELVSSACTFPLLHGEINNMNESKNMVNEKYSEYDPYLIPPIIELCERHQKATKVGPTLEEYNKITSEEDCEAIKDTTFLNEQPCPCCLQTNKISLPLCKTKSSDLFFLGPGFPLFFQFIHMSIILLAIIFCVSGIFNLFTNLYLNACGQPGTIILTQECKSSWWIRLSLLSKTNFSNYGYYQEINNLVTVIFCVLFLQYFRFKLRTRAFRCDEKLLSASDFTIQASNFPSDARNEEIEEFFENILRNMLKYEGEIAEIIKVNRAFNINSVFEINKNQILVSKRENQLKRMNETKLQNNFKNEAAQNLKIETTEKEIQNIRSTIERLNEEKLATCNFTGVAFITFQTPQQVKAIQKIFNDLGLWKRMHIKFQQWFHSESPYLFQNRLIKVKRAPEPNDILWQNMGVTWWERFQKKIITTISTFFTLLFSFCLILGVTYAQRTIHKNYPDLDFAPKQILNNVGTVCIVLINQCMNYIIESFTTNEKHITKTAFDCSLAQKKVIGIFLNTTMIYILISYAFENFVGQNGLVDSLFSIYLSNIIVHTMLQIFDPLYLLKIFQRWRLKKNLETSNLIQSEANNLFEQPKLNIAFLFSSVLNMMLFSSFYSSLIPIGPLLGIITLIVYYWVYKFLLLRRASTPNLMGKKVAYEMIELAEYVPLLLSLGDIIFVKILEKESYFINEIGILICCMNFILPMKWVNKKLFRITDKARRLKETYNVNFKDVFENIIYDYDLSNPITHKNATKSRVEVSKRNHRIKGKMKNMEDLDFNL